jgi:hypothetical protein
MANLLTTASVMMCPHGGTISVITQNTKVMTGGSPLVRSSTFVIAGCSLAALPTPSPCVQVNWVKPDGKSQAGDDFTLSEDSVGLCLAGTMAPQGNVAIDSTQAKGSSQ